MMKNLQSSAFVAKTTQLLSSVANLRLLFVMLLTLCSSANMWGAEVTFDLTKASYNSSSQTEVVWTSTPVTMKIEKGSSSTNANNYLGGTNSNTRCCSGQVFSVSVSSGYELKTIVITSTSSSYIMPTSGWSNATATSNGSDVTVTANSGATVISVKPGGTKRLTKVEITYESSTPAVPCTVTFNAGSGTCDKESETETSAGAGVTLPTPTLTGCDEWSFAGWAEASVATETAEAPSNLYEADDTYKPTSDITLYAVYQRTETTEGGGSTTHAFGWENADDESKWTISNFSAKGVYSSYKSAGSYAASTNSKTTGYIQYTEKLSPTDISCKYTKATSNTNSSSKFIIQTSTDGSSWTDAATGATMNDVTQGTFKTLSWTGSLSDVYVRIYYTGTNAVRVLDEVSITATGGGGSTTYYHSTPQCSTETLVSVLPKIMNF